MESLEQRTIAKVSARLVPFLIVCFFVAYLDRVNVSFAALTMNKDLGLSASAFGFGAGIFFLAYFLFEVPSNLFLERVGARKWIARIMFTWGLVSGGMAFVVGAPEAELRAEELIEWARAAMANYKVPRAVEIVDDLPVNATGKVEKEVLRARAASRRAS